MNAAFRHALLAIQRRLMGFDPSLIYATAIDEVVGPPPIFLLGAPRTGSTLFAQAALGRYRLAYISNVMALMPRYMVRMVRMHGRIAGPYRSPPKESQWGYVSGFLAPNEAGQIMSEWFNDSMSPEDRRLVVRTIQVISLRVGGPMFFKNQANTLRLPQVLETFPDARFILLRRHPLYTAQSILLAREAILGTRAAWWSVRPPGCEGNGHDPCQEVLCQIHELERIAGKLRELGDAHFAELWYEDFCVEPAATLDRLARRFGLVPQEPAALLPTTFPRSKRVRVDAETWDRLSGILAGMAGGDGISGDTTVGRGKAGGP